MNLRYFAWSGKPIIKILEKYENKNGTVVTVTSVNEDIVEYKYDCGAERTRPVSEFIHKFKKVIEC